MGQYLHRVYRLMATELFGIDPEIAKALDYTLTEADLNGYDPGQFFTSTEMIDTVPRLDQVPTEDDLLVLTNGIPATLLVSLSKYPSGDPPPGNPAAAGAGKGKTKTKTSGKPPGFSKPPSP